MQKGWMEGCAGKIDWKFRGGWMQKTMKVGEIAAPDSGLSTHFPDGFWWA
jgi:hypothetical protein